MTLDKRTVPLRVGGGMMEGDDAYLVDPPAHLRCENVRFDARGALSKRFGFDLVPSTGRPATDKGEPSTLVDAGGQLVMLGPRGTYALDEQRSAWAELGSHSPRVSEVLTDSLVRVNEQIRNVQIATVGEVLCAVWEAYYSTTDFEVYYQFHDANTLAVLSGPTLIANLIHSPKIVGTSTHFLLYGTVSGGAVEGAVYAASAGTYTFPTPSNIGGSFAEALPFGNEFLVMREAAGVTTFDLRDTALASVWTQATAQGFIGRAVCHNALASAFYAVSPTGQVARCADDGLSTPTIAAIWTPPTDLEVQRATIGRFDAAGNMVAILSGRGYDPSRTVSSKSECGCSYATINTTPAKLSDDTLPTVVLAGHAHYLADTDTDVFDLVVPMALQSRDENVDLGTGAYIDGGLNHSIGYVMRSIGSTTQFGLAEAGRFGVDRIDKTGDIHSAFTGSSAVRPDSFNLSRAVVMPNGFLAWGYSTKIELQRAAAGPWTRFNRRGGDIMRCRLTNARAARHATAQGLRVLGCGHGASVLDATRHVEATPMRPPLLQADGFDEGMPETFLLPEAPGIRRLRIVHRWRDAKGNVYRGAPSPYEILGEPALAPGVKAWTTGSDTVSGYPRRLSFLVPYPTALSEDSGLQLEVEVYQTGDISTGADSETYYFAGSAVPQRSGATPALSYPSTMASVTLGFDDPGAGALAGVDTRHYVQISQASAESLPVAYFNEQLQPAQLPPLLDIVSTQSRLWALSAEDRLSVRATTPLRPLEGPVWPAELEYRVPAEGGECVALAALGDKIAIFKERLIYVLFGNPADALGNGETIQTPRLIPSDVGCVNPLSVVEGSFGVVFQTERGFYQLDGATNVAFIGDPVKDALDGRRITSGVLVPEHSEVRWTLDANLTGGHANTDEGIVWNYRLGTWARWTQFPALHATMWEGKHCRLTASAFVAKETDDWSNASFETRVTTAWIKLTGTQGFARIWRAMMLLRWWSGFVRVGIQYDYDETTVDLLTWNETELAAMLPGSGRRVQPRIRPSNQKCESIRFDVREVTSVESQDPPFPTIGQGMELVGIDLEVGVKKGLYKRVGADGRK